MSRLPLFVRLAPLLSVLTGCHGDRGAEMREAAPIALLDELPTPQPLPRATTRYTLRARLDEKRHEVQGSGTIGWTNRSDRATDEIWLHLYLNAFSKGSLFLRGAGGRSGGLAGREGRIDIQRLSSPTFADRDLWPSADRHSPGDPNDRTDIRVPLPEPVAPGATLELQVEFTAVLPEIVERTGYSGDYHFVAQWFPKLARLERDGTWAHFPFHAFAEFYADFDDYEVVLDVPANHRVGATGSLQPLAQGGQPAGEPGRARYVARAESVVDFAWSSSPGFGSETRRLGPTLVHLLHEEDEPLVRRAHWETLSAGLEDLGRWLGDYPYPELTVVVPGPKGERSGGMEYPSLITTGGGEMAPRLGIRAAELLVIHELAHQWFQSLVATNEAEYPFLDEGLASYAEWRFLQSRYGSGSLVSLLGLRLSRNAGGRFAALYGRESGVAINQPARDFSSFQVLAREIYCRTPLVLETLARTFGRRAVDSAVAAYARQGRGGHPTPPDFYRTLAAYLGEEHLPMIVELFDRPGRFNLGLASVATQKAADGEFESTIVVEQTAGPSLPYEVLVDFGVAGRRRLLGTGAAKRETFSIHHAQPLKFVHLDPDEHLVLDDDPIDDRWAARTDEPPPRAFLAAFAAGFELLSFGLSP